MSSKAARMRPLGFEIRKVRDFLKKAPNWFLDSPDNIISSDFLEILLSAKHFREAARKKG